MTNQTTLPTEDQTPIGFIVADNTTHKATKVADGILIQLKAGTDPGYLLTTVEDAVWELAAIELGMEA